MFCYLQGNLRQWLMDPHCYDQFSVIYEGGDRTAIWNNVSGEPVVLEERSVSPSNLPFIQVCRQEDKCWELIYVFVSVVFVTF